MPFESSGRLINKFGLSVAIEESTLTLTTWASEKNILACPHPKRLLFFEVILLAILGNFSQILLIIQIVLFDVFASFILVESHSTIITIESFTEAV